MICKETLTMLESSGLVIDSINFVDSSLNVTVTVRRNVAGGDRYIGKIRRDPAKSAAETLFLALQEALRQPGAVLKQAA